MEEAIRNFHQQFLFEPEIKNPEHWQKFGKFIVAGMGGSHLAADLIKIWRPELDLIVHSDYGLPALSGDVWKDRLVIVSSYSGNTEETIDAFNSALAKGLPVAAVSVGGRLLDLTKTAQIPYVQLPHIGIQPRSALGFSLRAFLKLMGEGEALQEIAALGHLLDPKIYEATGRDLARRLKGSVIIIYSSQRNLLLAYNWKIKFNETTKTPAFCNSFPELNHNEMIGFEKEAEKFEFIFLQDELDHPQISKRMQTLYKIFTGRGLRVWLLTLRGGSIFERIFGSLLTADWTAYYLAKERGIDPEAVPLVEDFKKLIAQ